MSNTNTNTNTNDKTLYLMNNDNKNEIDSVIQSGKYMGNGIKVTTDRKAIAEIIKGNKIRVKNSQEVFDFKIITDHKFGILVKVSNSVAWNNSTNI